MILKPLKILIFFFILGACAAPRGVYHKVEKGQTLWRISQTYGVDLQKLAEINNIRDPFQIRVGEQIFIPGVNKTRKVRIYKEFEEEKRLILQKGKFIWPVKGRVISHFGIRNGKKHNGIDITAPIGTPITASDSGMVVYAGWLRGYENLIIIEHEGGYTTTYAHNQINLVKMGQLVKKGEVIGKVGNYNSSPHLHFEIRNANKPINPLFFLP